MRVPFCWHGSARSGPFAVAQLKGSLGLLAAAEGPLPPLKQTYV